MARETLQIRLSRGSSGDAAAAGGGGGAANSSLPVETVTVACPDHLVLAELSVAKSLGAVTASAANPARSVGRRSRRNLGQKVHICVCCDFPIAIYGRLIPCEHAFCLACARSDSSCYLCDERIQKIQSIKMLEGIFVCAATHCLKTFLKRSEFELHVSETHSDLHQDLEREGGNETDAINTTRQSSVDPHRQSLQPETSTAHAPPRPGFSPSSNSQPQDREDRPRHQQSRDQPPPRTLPQLRPPPYHNQFQPQNSESQNGPPQHPDADQLHQDKQPKIAQESSFPNYSQPPPPNYPHPLNADQVLVPSPSFSFPHFPANGSQPYYSAPYEMPTSDQGSVLGILPAPSATDTFPRPWGMALVGMPFPPVGAGQGIPAGFITPGDPQGGGQFFQGDYGRIVEGLPMNTPFPGKEPELNCSFPLVAPLQLPPQPLQPPQQLNNNNFSSGWQNDIRGFGNAPE